MAKKKKSKVKDTPIQGVDFELFGDDEHKVTKEEVIELAEAINDNLKLDADDEIDVEAGIKEIIANVEELFDEIFTSDSFEDEQWATLYKMGCMPIQPAEDEDEEEPVDEWPEELMEKVEPFLETEEEEETEPEPEPEPKKKKGKGKGKKKKEPEPEPEEPEEEEEEEEEPEPEPKKKKGKGKSKSKKETPEDLLAELKKLKKKVDLDQFVEDHDIDVDTSERNPIKFKKVIGDAIKDESAPASEKETKKSSKKSKKEEAPKKEPKKSSKKETTSKSKSHEDAFMDALAKLGKKKSGTTMEALAEKGNEIYCDANDSEGSEKMQRKQGSVIIKALLRYGIVEQEGKTIYLLDE